MKTEATEQEARERIREVLRGCPVGLIMDKESSHAACCLLGEIETLQASVRLLQRREITGYVDANGEVRLRAADDTGAQINART